MARYPLISYRYDIILPTGTVATRIRCPDCGSLHYDIWESEERLCFGCGQVLSVYGLELCAWAIPDDWCGEQEQHKGEDPDYPTFWYYMDN